VSSHIGNQPQEELTKFGYRSERKVKKIKNPALFWRHADGTYESKIWQIQDFFKKIVALEHCFRILLEFFIAK